MEGTRRETRNRPLFHTAEVWRDRRLEPLGRFFSDPGRPVDDDDPVDPGRGSLADHDPRFDPCGSVYLAGGVI